MRDPWQFIRQAMQWQSFRIDIPFNEISIIPSSEGNLGLVRTQSSYVPDYEGFEKEEFFITRAIMCMAGNVAVRIITESSEEDHLSVVLAILLTATKYTTIWIMILRISKSQL